MANVGQQAFVAQNSLLVLLSYSTEQKLLWWLACELHLQRRVTKAVTYLSWETLYAQPTE